MSKVSADLQPSSGEVIMNEVNLSNTHLEATSCFRINKFDFFCPSKLDEGTPAKVKL